ncbi:hypothetical protein A2318_04435 [Candidatus Uhrbacteria bacterium RIFOXYB2_FULL_45_11]|uniref:D,D-heptose 1,7-bisphosphate phosphatase n=1 Tax=Candidatus Uhrbacteria bacterium RIFOXYB2_FULL_45_11 TaxID=1802421 RepID=A0A1F7W559_9BACT|nr:MAG: hypothetical protein A2318_04435 [Candidatus Uhrbacteria bacterium RIFOXYB2_FULL_45_11]
MANLRKAVFIDRDGVLNELVDRGEGFCLGGKPIRYTAPFTMQELRLKPDVQIALELIAKKGYQRILVTNQPDIKAGRINPTEFEQMMDLFRALPLNAVYVCKHLPNDGCNCRKPLPGMLLNARDEQFVDMHNSFMIGDLETDVQAGQAAGVRTIRLCNEMEPTNANHRVLNIMEAAKLLP